MVEHDTIIKGLTDQEVDASAKQYGYNRQHFDQQSGFLQLLREIVTEPMFLLLVAAASIYFITGDRNDGFFMLGALFFVSAISVFQDLRSRNAIAALR
ncbi:MAG TPA: cation-transporting P-type ATPase, partial [Ferruginibacter sp.]|nr:cation-transporting P-type ATPase [Ferruginibacter sp.]